MTQPILSLQELSKYYVNGQNVVAGLNKVSLSFECGEFVAITGESGSGKSSLAHILGGILPYEDGELFFDGKPTSHYDSSDWERYRAESVGFISQQYGILPGATVLENVISALRLTGIKKSKAASEAKCILEKVELWPMRNRRAAKLSSGQKQRLSIARALAKPCSILIADEPTGNLDPENSEKVISLLAKAAEDRLVILITHEFSEAEEYVTRHISLHDGRVCADARLRPHTPVHDFGQKRKVSGDLSGYISRLQMKSRPAWSIIMLVFMMITAFAVFAFLGSFIVALDDTPTRIYEGDAFLNGDKNRIVAVREDLQLMTQADYDNILSIKHVQSLEKFGYIKDTCYAYQEDTDYVINYTKYNYGTFHDPEYIELETPEIISTEQYMQTIPLFADDEEFLTAGKLPQQFNEVVAAGGEDMLGQKYTVYIMDLTEWKAGSYIQLEVTVTGVTDKGSGLYFHDDVAKTMTLDYLGAEYTYIPYYSEVPSDAEYINYRESRSKAKYGPLCPPFHAVCEPAENSSFSSLKDTEIIISMGIYTDILTEDPTADYERIYRMPFITETGTWNIAGIHRSGLDNLISVTPEMFRKIIDQSGIGNGDQVSITIDDYAYTQRVIDALKDMGYYALSPYVLGSAKVDPELAAQRMQTLFICIGTLLFVLLLQLIVLRAMFSMETDSYRILSDMGLKCCTAQRSIFWQVLAFTAVGQILGFAGIGICSGLGIEQIAGITKYLYGYLWLIISAVHFISTAIAAGFIAAGLKKKVYPRTARIRDLIIDEEDEEQ